MKKEAQSDRLHYFSAMNSQDMYFTPGAHETFQRIIMDMQEVSLLSAEKVRSRIFHKLHLIHHHPSQGSKKLELPGLDGNIRVATVLSYKIYFKVEDKRIIVLDILLDKEVKSI